MFADDCKLYFSFAKDEIPTNLQREIDILYQWTKQMQLQLAIEKCAALHLGTKNPQTIYKIGGHAIENVDNMRDLGIIVSKDLQFSKHCQTLVKLAGQRMNCILRSFQSRNTKFLIKCFITFVRTKLEYGSQIWSPYQLDDIDLVESIQREFTRRIPAIKVY